MKKEDLGLMVVIIDFIVILFFIYFVYFLNKKQDEYIELFQTQTIEMDDFTLELSNMPLKTEKNCYNQELALKALIWQQMQDLMWDQYEEDLGKPIQYFESMDEYQIVDISFASTDTKDIEHVTKLKDLRDELNELNEHLRQYEEAQIRKSSKGHPMEYLKGPD